MLTVACVERDALQSSDQRRDTLALYADGTPQQVAVYQGDSIVERRTYRRTGILERVETSDSVQTYLDLHSPDSATVLEDYFQGRWRNLSADTSRERPTAFYVFGRDQLRFEDPSRAPLETLGVQYNDERTLVTEDGMSVRPHIRSFDTVQVTGYTLVRHPPADSL